MLQVKHQYSSGFGGKYGVQKDRQDKSAHTWEEREGLAKHESQKGDDAIQPLLYAIYATDKCYKPYDNNIKCVCLNRPHVLRCVTAAICLAHK